MKNKLLSLMLVILLVLSSLSLAGCDFAFLDSDEDIEKKNFDKLVSCLDTKDSTVIKALFAPNKISDIDNFDESIEELLSYYKGDYVSHRRGGTITENDAHDGVVTKNQVLSYDITTTIEVYRMGIKWYIEDTGDIGNVGIWSLYVIKFADDPRKNNSYRGDGLWTAGINIGKFYVPSSEEKLQP